MTTQSPADSPADSPAATDVASLLNRLPYTRSANVLGCIASGGMLLFVSPLFVAQSINEEVLTFGEPFFVLFFSTVAALMILGLFLVILGFALLLNRVMVRRNLQSMMTETNLANWTYTREEWQLYTEHQRHQYEAERRAAIPFWRVTLAGTVLFAVFGFIVGCLASDVFWQAFLGSAMVGMVVAATLYICGRFLAVRWILRISDQPGPAHLSLDGLFLHSRYEFWDKFGRGKIRVKMGKWKELTLLIFYDEVTLINGCTKCTFEIVVPVPLGQEVEAFVIGSQFISPPT